MYIYGAVWNQDCPTIEEDIAFDKSDDCFVHLKSCICESLFLVWLE